MPRRKRPRSIWAGHAERAPDSAAVVRSVFVFTASKLSSQCFHTVASQRQAKTRKYAQAALPSPAKSGHAAAST